MPRQKWALLPIARRFSNITNYNVKKIWPSEPLAGPGVQWSLETPNQREGKVMYMPVFFLGLGLGVICGWIGMALVANLRLLWQGPIVQGIPGRPGLAHPLQSPR